MIYEYSEKDPYSEFYRNLRKTHNPSVIIKLLSEIDVFQISGTISEKESLELRAIAFNQLREIADNQLEQTQNIILNELLPLSLQDDEDLRSQYRSFREILSKWIEEHSQEDMEFLRNEIIKMLIPLIGGDKHKPVCWLISTIGYGNPNLYKELWNHAIAWNNENGDLSLSTLSWIGLSIEQKKIVSEELHKRSEERFNNHLAFAIARLKDTESIKKIISNWLERKGRKTLNVDVSLAFTAIREIIDSFDSDFILQDYVWHNMVELINSEPKELFWNFNIGHIFESCNSFEVIPTIFNWIAEKKDWFENPNWTLYLMELRAQSCIKPRQLEGWHQINNDHFFELLKSQVTINTDNDSFASSQEEIAKENAWKTLLYAGYEPALQLFDQVVSNERGRFIRGRIMKYLECFRYESLPQKVVDWVTETYDEPKTQDGRELSFRIEAIHMAKSASTIEAFDVLLNFGLTVEGQVLDETVKAISTVAITLLSQGNTEVINKLFTFTTESQVVRQRMACTYVLARIASFSDYKELFLRYINSFLSMLDDENRSPIEHEQIIRILDRCADWNIPDNLISKLKLVGSRT